MSAAVRLAVLAGLLALAAADIPSLSQVKEAAKPKPKVPFKACIDDSDCAGQGTDYACFQYLCYPWKDDSKIAKKDKMKTCKSSDHCANGLECYRHPDRRNIYMGLCMEAVVDCSENGQEDCKQPGNKGPNKACCNGAYCCQQDYFSQLQQLPCVSHQPCRDMGYGNFCCPDKSNSTLPSVCCNEDPNPPPPTTTTPRPRARASGAETAATAASSLLLAAALLSLRQ